MPEGVDEERAGPVTGRKASFEYLDAVGELVVFEMWLTQDDHRAFDCGAVLLQE